jgi:two-component system cell cycle response regulator CtrA
VRILVADSSNERNLEIVLTCRNHEVVVHFAEDGDEAISILTREAYDVVVIAPGLDDYSPNDLVRRLRNCKVATPILVLGERSTPQFRARCLWDGADDVLDTPWDREEMLAVLRSLARRGHGHAASRIQIGPLTVDQESMRILREGKPLPITEKEYLIVELLATRMNRVCTKMDFMNHLYGGLDEPEEKIIDVFVCKARKKLREHGIVITTVWGRGYMLKSDDLPGLPAQAAA